MSVLKISKILTTCVALSFLLSACNSGQSAFTFSQYNPNLKFDEGYLVNAAWYAIASTSEKTECLAKYVFVNNKLVTASKYNNDDGVSLETKDLLYSITTDTRLSIDKKFFYNYQSHGKQFFISEEAHFFKDYDEAIRYADERGRDCRNSLPV